MNDEERMRQMHEQTRELVAQAAAAPYGAGLDIIKQSGYWDERRAPRDDGKDWYEVTLDVSICARTTLHVRAESAEEADRLACREARDLDMFEMDDGEISDVQVRSVEKGVSP